MPAIYNNAVALRKMEQAIQDLSEVQAEGVQKLRQFLIEAVAESRGHSRAYDERLLRR
jgi:hypothetical protein